MEIANCHHSRLPLSQPKLHLTQSRSIIRSTRRSTLAPQAKNPRYIRFASTAPPTVVTRARNLVLGAVLGGVIVFGYYYITDTRAGVHRWITVPLLRYLYPDAEEGHEFGTKALKTLHQWGLHPRERGDPDAAGDLEIEVDFSLLLLVDQCNG